MNPGETIGGTIESIAYRGAGILRSAEGIVVFVHGGVCAGERVVARVTRLHARFAESELVTVESPAPERIAPVCRLVDGTRVPGCVYDHLAYPAELTAKQAQLTDFLRGAWRQTGRADLDGNPAAVPLPPTPSPLPLAYRNKIVLHAGRTNGVRALGYLGDDNRTLVDIPRCPLACDGINHELATLRADPAFRRAVRDGDDVTLRWTPANGVAAWIGRPSPHASPLTEHAFFGDLEVPLDGFYQVNPAVADLLASALAELAAREPPHAVIDAYCGIGILGLAILSRLPSTSARLLGMETGRAAVAAARRNARRLGFAAEYACCPVADGIDAALAETGTDGTLAVLDPPRDGLDPATLRALLRHPPERIAYVSCSPDRLARDLARLCARDGGAYDPVSVRLFDMFPRTMHFETLALLRRRPSP